MLPVCASISVQIIFVFVDRAQVGFYDAGLPF
jgi:hypothetical protein